MLRATILFAVASLATVLISMPALAQVVSPFLWKI